MPGGSGPADIVHLGWRANRDDFDVALAVNRLLSAGAQAWRFAAQHERADAGDYLAEVTPARQAALGRLGITVTACRTDIPALAQPIARPAVRLLAGTASKYPYFGYYALCLLRLGIDYVACDGASLARGALDDANLLILPGGFATWGIDRAEDAPGADARVRGFLARGGAAIGSCGGAYYLSAGRPGWTGTAAAKPLYTHEYLQSGVGVVAIALRPGPLALGCPPTLEVPYYHGPIYDALGDGIDVAATFHALALPGRLAIDNPLDAERFERDMRGKAAILTAAGARGRAVLFSPHPEMGDLIRKYIALDGYVRRYLPIRGFGTMRDTLRHYHVADSPSFRLVHNAVHALLGGTVSQPHSAHAVADAANRSPAGEIDEAGARIDKGSGDDALARLCAAGLEALPDFGRGEEGDLLRDVAAGIASRFEAAAAASAALPARASSLAALMPARLHLLAAIAGHQRSASHRPAAELLMEADLGVALLETWTRAAQFDLALAGVGEREGPLPSANRPPSAQRGG